MSRASALYRLQLVDTSIDQARRRLAEVDAELASDEKVRLARESFDRAQSLQRQTAAASRAAEDALATHRRKLEETEKKLYGGGVRNPKELQELQAEAEALTRHMSTLEDRVLEEMARLEQADEEAASRGTALELAEADAAGRHQTLTKERQTLGASLAQKTVEREAVVSGVDPASLQTYETLRRSSGGLAVTLMEDGACQACGLALSASDRQDVRSATTLVRCRQCGRVLLAG